DCLARLLLPRVGERRPSGLDPGTPERGLALMIACGDDRSRGYGVATPLFPRGLCGPRRVGLGATGYSRGCASIEAFPDGLDQPNHDVEQRRAPIAAVPAARSGDPKTQRRSPGG